MNKIPTILILFGAACFADPGDQGTSSTSGGTSGGSGSASTTALMSGTDTGGSSSETSAGSASGSGTGEPPDVGPDAGAACTQLEEPCDSPTECCSGVCSEGFCALLPGESCENSNQCSHGECYDGVCVQCKKQLGQTCGESFNACCTSAQAICTWYGSCAYPPGVPCATKYECSTKMCLNNICDDCRQAGIGCTEDANCCSGVCMDGLVCT